MTGKEYLAILQENGFRRTKLVRILEQQVAVFEKYKLHDQAEMTKWHIFEVAEIEKERGALFEDSY